MIFASGSLSGPKVRIEGKSGRPGRPATRSRSTDVEAARRLAVLCLREERMSTALIAAVLGVTETWVNSAIREMEEIANGTESIASAETRRARRGEPPEMGN